MTSVFVRLYSWALQALPRAAREDRPEMAATFSDQLSATRGGADAGMLVLRAFVRLPFVIAAEWIDRARGHAPAHEGAIPEVLTGTEGENDATGTR